MKIGLNSNTSEPWIAKLWIDIKILCMHYFADNKAVFTFKCTNNFLSLCNTWWNLKSPLEIESKASDVPCQCSNHWAAKTQYIDSHSHLLHVTWWQLYSEDLTLQNFTEIEQWCMSMYAFTSKTSFSAPSCPCLAKWQL